MERLFKQKQFLGQSRRFQQLTDDQEILENSRKNSKNSIFGLEGSYVSNTYYLEPKTDNNM